LKNVSFRVEGGEFCFVGFDKRVCIHFFFWQGQTVAIVGATGSGKSTLARLLVRYYDCDEGFIKVSGQDIRTLKQKSLRRAIGVVAQDTVLFNTTIGFNIAFGACSDGPVSQEQLGRKFLSGLVFSHT
jgi:ABC-type multidrug transport system fused ATPase/permease subunit